MEINFKQLFSVDVKMAGECMEKLNKRLNGKITQDELELWCAEQLAELKGDLRFEAMPTAPVALRKYEATVKALDIKDKESLSKEIFSDESVSKYMTECESIMSRNLSNVSKLEWTIEVLKSNNKHELAKEVWKIYNDYPDKITYLKGVRTKWVKKSY